MGIAMWRHNSAKPEAMMIITTIIITAIVTAMIVMVIVDLVTIVGAAAGDHSSWSSTPRTALRFSTNGRRRAGSRPSRFCWRQRTAGNS
jgi:hypothetical protein